MSVGKHFILSKPWCQSYFLKLLSFPLMPLKLKPELQTVPMLFATESEVRMHLLLFIVAHQLQSLLLLFSSLIQKY